MSHLDHLSDRQVSMSTVESDRADGDELREDTRLSAIGRLQRKRGRQFIDSCFPIGYIAAVAADGLHRVADVWQVK